MPAPPSQPPKGRFLRTVRTVAWAFFGVGRHKPDEPGAPSLSPLQILVTALIFVLVFVLTLVAVAIGVSQR